MIPQELQFMWWTFAVAIAFALLTALWGFIIDIPRKHAQKQLVHFGRFEFTHHWFEYPAFYLIGLPVGAGTACGSGAAWAGTVLHGCLGAGLHPPARVTSICLTTVTPGGQRPK
jgi:hypothetical protein